LIICPICQNEEVAGAVFCSNCGVQLVGTKVSKTHKINTSQTESKLQQTVPFIQTPQIQLNSWASLHMVESGQIISLAGQDEFTLGRGSEGQPIMPDVDLTAYNAYAKGVSRLHCIIKKGNGKAILVDIGSSNGTYLNGVRISPHVEANINHGDVISLGKLKIQILVNQDQVNS
jgi:hypothetical protein